MAKESMQPASESLLTLVPYVVLIIFAATSLQFFRLAISTTFVRGVLYVMSWPAYLVLLPVRALIFLTNLSIQIAFYGAVAAILYGILYGALNFEMIKDTFGAVLQFL